MGYSEQMAARTLPVKSNVLALNVIDEAPEEAARLSLPPSAQLLKLERVRLAAGEPFALETCYLAASDSQGLTRAALEQWKQKPTGDPCLDKRAAQPL